jgi:hypothetical protein
VRDIVTEFLPPARTGKRQRAIILCDGMPSIPRKQPLAEFLSAKGYWVFYPRYRGAWESGGEFLARSPHLDILDERSRRECPRRQLPSCARLDGAEPRPHTSHFFHTSYFLIDDW